MRILTVFTVSVLVFLTSCAKDSGKISASYVSPLEYQQYDCNQLSRELTRIGRKLQEVAGVQDKEAGQDSTTMTVGMILFWPALFFLEGDTGREAELARLRRVDAIEQVAVEKDCHKVLAEIEQRRRIAIEEAEKKKRKECNAGVCK